MAQDDDFLALEVNGPGVAVHGVANNQQVVIDYGLPHLVVAVPFHLGKLEEPYRDHLLSGTRKQQIVCGGVQRQVVEPRSSYRIGSRFFSRPFSSSWPSAHPSSSSRRDHRGIATNCRLSCLTRGVIRYTLSRVFNVSWFRDRYSALDEMVRLLAEEFQGRGVCNSCMVLMIACPSSLPPIPNPMHGLDDLRVFGVEFDAFAELRDVLIEGATAGQIHFAPARVEDIVAGHGLAGVVE